MFSREKIKYWLFKIMPYILILIISIYFFVYQGEGDSATNDTAHSNIFGRVFAAFLSAFSFYEIIVKIKDLKTDKLQVFLKDIRTEITGSTDVAMVSTYDRDGDYQILSFRDSEQGTLRYQILFKEKNTQNLAIPLSPIVCVLGFSSKHPITHIYVTSINIRISLDGKYIKNESYSNNNSVILVGSAPNETISLSLFLRLERAIFNEAKKRNRPLVIETEMSFLIKDNLGNQGKNTVNRKSLMDTNTGILY